MNARRIYLDHHATTPCDPRVVEAMLPWFTERAANAASRQHTPGQEARRAVEEARAEVAALAGASPKEVVFTSGATEALNLALKGLVAAARTKSCHVVTTAIEHEAVLDVCRALERGGAAVTIVPVSEGGLVDPDDVAKALRPETVAVAVMAANNEIGTLQPLEALGALCAERRVVLVSDAAQAAGKVPLDFAKLGVGLLALSAHKMYGPQGVGALVVRRRPPVRLEPLVHGGGHERGLRSGTLNLPGVVGFGRAAALARAERDEDALRTRTLRDRLWASLFGSLDGVRLNGAASPRLPNNLNVSFEGIVADEVLRSLPDLALSSGSACTTANLEPSHVLRAIGLPEALVHGSIRFGLGRWTTAEEVDRAAELLVDAVRRNRAARYR